MQSAAQRKEINNLLGSHGLGQLDNAGGLMAQLAFLIRDSAHFGQLLLKCAPEDRRAMYDSLKPNLRFAPKPLDDYLREAREDAEARQLPVLDPETGLLQAYRVPEIGVAHVQAALEGWNAKGSLELVCRKCTTAETFPAATKADAIHAARAAGWTYGLDLEGKGRELCPECPAFRPQVTATLS